PNDHVIYVKNPHFWKPGLPYLDAVNYKIIPDEQSRIAALRAGTIDGGVVSPDNAQAINGTPNLVVLHNLTAAFRELQFTVKAGENKPWADKRVRQAINFAINRQNLIDKVYAGFGRFSGHVAAGYGPWVIPDDELHSKYENYTRSGRPGRRSTRSGSRAGSARRRATRSRSGASSATAASRSTRPSGCRCTTSSTTC